MKYMGSKRAMLTNGLGELLSQEAHRANRFVDLFAGSGAVAIHVAQRYRIPVIAFDLQQYSAVLCDAVISRESDLAWANIWSDWKRSAKRIVNSYEIPPIEKLTQALVRNVRTWCEEQSDLPITKAYGGHYFSPEQTVWIDAFRKAAPSSQPEKQVALASLIQTASQTAAAPGHTAQPFQPTRTAKQFLAEAWGRDIHNRVESAFQALSKQFALARGGADVCDANDAAEQVEDGDLVFIDPPYSGVHYSRFYHVLETIAVGSCGEVSGTGRYPAAELRPRSKYSVGSESEEALDELLETVAEKGARAILTFPDHVCSNGLSGDSVREIASSYFRVREKQIESRFSTLGGNGSKSGDYAGRAARHHAKELMLLLEP